MTASPAAPPLAAAALPGPAEVMSQARAENFTVASRLLGRDVRRHLLAVYGYARLVDDAGDEAGGDRWALLERIEHDLDRVYRGETPAHPLLRELAPTVRACAIPAAPLRALIEANRADQRHAGYETFEQLLGYCELSANPVGQLVLHVFGAATPERIRMSDDVCTALQLIEHWQDVAEDQARGRVYLPRADCARFGVERSDLAAAHARGRLRALLAFEADRARELLDRGAPLVATLTGRRAFAVAAFVGGGRAALAALERAGYDVLAGPPQATRTARLRATLAAWRGGGRPA